MQKLWKIITSPFRKHAGWWNNYLTELSVFVISLSVTYYADGLVDSYVEKQEDHEAMMMVKNELISNLAELYEIEDYYKKEIQLSETLRKALSGKIQLKEDSVRSFYNQHRLYYYWFLKSNAFDMIRESGTMQRMDKSLLTQLFGCYEQMEVVKDMGARYREERISELLQFTNGLPGGRNAETTIGQWNQIDRNPNFRQYLLISLPLMAKSALAIDRNTTQLVQGMLDTIDKSFPSEE